MDSTELAVVGAGPAGVCGALEAASHGVRVTILDRADRLGGQLVKQTHKFFGRHDKFAGTRGILIASELEKEVLANPNITFMGESEVLGCYKDRELLVETPSGVQIVKFDKLLISTGASEKMLPFPGNDLPGVYGAGAVQTLMNVYGVRPGDSVLMVGSGNIGLIVSYQLVQAGVRVECVVEALPNIGGYAVHASKIRRLGIPILTRHSVKEARGKDHVEEAVIWELDKEFNGVPGTERTVKVDVVCLATGLTPLADLLWQAGAEMRYIGELGGFVPLYDENMETTVEGVFVAGDVAGIEEASTAMIEGRIAGLSVARSLGRGPVQSLEERKAGLVGELSELRAGPTGEKILKGLREARALLRKRVGVA